MEQYQFENAEIIHAGLTPFRFIYTLLKWLGLLVFVGLWSLSVWLFGFIGGDGMDHRKAIADTIYKTVSSPYGSTVDGNWHLDTVDMTRRPEPMAYGPEHLIMPQSTGGLVFVDPGHSGAPMLAGVSSTTGDDVCVPGADYDTSSGPWEDRDRDALRRKSVVMEAAYTNGVIMASSLRRLLSLLKQDPNLQIDSANPIFRPGIQGLCNVDYYFPGSSQQVYDDQVAQSQAIHLSGAPVVAVLHWHGRITGMCLQFNCGQNATANPGIDFTYRVTWLSDLFADDPPLTKNQEYAVRRLNAMSSDRFWLMTAYENGIHDKARVLWLASLARAYRDQVMWPKGKPSHLDMD